MREKVVHLGEHGNLVGILTEPDRGPEVLPAFLFLNAGILHRVGPNRLHVNIARALADDGFSSVRFDTSGLGDSDVRRDGLPYHESRLAETQEVMDHLQTKTGIDRFVPLGLCSGADHAFRLACEDKRVVGAVLLDSYAYRTRKFYVLHYGRRLRRIKGWRDLLVGTQPAWEALKGKFSTFTSRSQVPSVERFVIDTMPREEAEKQIRQLTARAVNLLFIYTGSLWQVYDYPSQFTDMFPSLTLDGKLRVCHYPQADHTFNLISAQNQLIQEIRDWARASMHGKERQDFTGKAPSVPECRER